MAEDVSGEGQVIVGWPVEKGDVFECVKPAPCTPWTPGWKYTAPCFGYLEDDHGGMVPTATLHTTTFRYLGKGAGTAPEQAVDGYPDGNPKTAIGATKPPLSCVPPAAMFQLGQAMKDGKEKYGLMNWREHNVSSSVYYDAAMRHMMSWWDGEDEASDSKVHHLAHTMACCAILLDAEMSKKLNDDRPMKGPLAEFLKAKTAGTTPAGNRP